MQIDCVFWCVLVDCIFYLLFSTFGLELAVTRLLTGLVDLGGMKSVTYELALLYFSTK